MAKTAAGEEYQQVVGSNPSAGSLRFRSIRLPAPLRSGQVFSIGDFSFTRGVLDVEAPAHDAVGILRAIVVDSGFKEQ